MTRAREPVTVALRRSLVALVLANLGFVALTEAARWTWLAPLVLLTLLAPRLLPLTRFFAYRAAWKWTEVYLAKKIFLMNRSHPGKNNHVI